MIYVLLRQLESHCQFSAYAGQLLLVEGRSRAEIEKKDPRLMSLVGDWSSRVGVQVSVDKTVLMLLRGQLSPTRPPNIRSAGKAIRYVTQVKYLGLTIG